MQNTSLSLPKSIMSLSFWASMNLFRDRVLAEQELLDSFLADPDGTIANSGVVVPIHDGKERRSLDLVTYLDTLPHEARETVIDSLQDWVLYCGGDAGGSDSGAGPNTVSSVNAVATVNAAVSVNAAAAVNAVAVAAVAISIAGYGNPGSGSGGGQYGGDVDDSGGGQ